MVSFRTLTTTLALIALTSISGSSFAADPVANESGSEPAPAAATPAPVLEPLTAASVNPIARPGRTGLGFSLNTYNPGLTIKSYLTNQFAAQLLVGTLVEFGGISIGLDGVFEAPFMLQNKHMALKSLLGAGISRTTTTAYDLPVMATYVTALSGMGIQFKGVPLETVFEARLGLINVAVEEIGSERGLAYDFGFTTRYFF